MMNLKDSNPTYPTSLFLLLRQLAYYNARICCNKHSILPQSEAQQGPRTHPMTQHNHEGETNLSNHRITELQALERISRNHEVQQPAKASSQQ